MDAVPDIEGMDFDDAQEFLSDTWSLRIASINGRHFPLTRDYRTDRINVDLINNKITNLYLG